MTDYKPEPYNLARPAHLIANEVIRRIEGRNAIQLGELSHADVEQLVSQYQDKLLAEEQKLLRELHARQERIRELEAQLRPFKAAAQALHDENYFNYKTDHIAVTWRFPIFKGDKHYTGVDLDGRDLLRLLE